MRHWIIKSLGWMGFVASRTLEGATSGLVGASVRPGLEGLEGRVNPAPLMLRPLSGMPLTEHLMEDATLLAPAPVAQAPVEVSTHTGIGLVTEITPRSSEAVVDSLFCSLVETGAQESVGRFSAIDNALAAQNTPAEPYDQVRHERHVDSALLGWALAGGALVTTWWVGSDERYTKRPMGLRLAA